MATNAIWCWWIINWTKVNIRWLYYYARNNENINNYWIFDIGDTKYIDHNNMNTDNYNGINRSGNSPGYRINIRWQDFVFSFTIPHPDPQNTCRVQTHDLETSTCLASFDHGRSDLAMHIKFSCNYRRDKIRTSKRCCMASCLSLSIEPYLLNATPSKPAAR